MEYYLIGDRWCDSTELYHHGVKGMKWGVRKKRIDKLSKKVHRQLSKRGVHTINLTKGGKTDTPVRNKKNKKQRVSLGRTYVNNSTNMNWLMQQSINQINMQNANRNNSLSLSGGMNPFMFG